MSDCSFDELNRPGWRVHNADLAALCADKTDLASIANARLDGVTIHGIAVADLLAYWHAGQGAKSA